MTADAAINWNFARTPGYIDPRATFARASVGRGIDRLGKLLAAPANAGRWRWNPVTGAAEGLLIESQRTNLLLRSEEFDNASWTKTDLTVTADSVAAPDGTTTADTLAATAASGNVAQAVTITAGRGIAFAVWLRAGATSFASLKLSDGSNTVEAWFNLASGAVGSNTAGAGSLVYSDTDIIDHGGGWYRCILTTLSSAVTTITASVSPAASDSAAAANTDSLYAWGAQIEAAATSTNATSYIPTTTATVTRSPDYLTIATDARWCSTVAGTMYFEFVMQTVAPTAGSQALYFGELATDVNARIVVLRNSVTENLNAAFITGGVFVQNLSLPATFAAGSRIRAAVAWASNDVAFSVNGAAPATASTYTPLSPVALAIGTNAYASVATTSAFAACAAFRYIPARVSNADLIAMTSD